MRSFRASCYGHALPHKVRIAHSKSSGNRKIKLTQAWGQHKDARNLVAMQKRDVYDPP